MTHLVVQKNSLNFWILAVSNYVEILVGQPRQTNFPGENSSSE